jgi:Na+-driven multidrug efflux pump
VRQSFAAALVLSVPVALFAYPFVVLVYGDSWRGSALPFVILLVALLALVIESPVRNLLLRIGRPLSISVAAIGAMLVNVALNLALLRVLGLAGAALASTVSYWLAAGLMLWLLARRTGEPVLASLLRPQRDDLVVTLGRRGIAWLSGRRAGRTATTTEGEWMNGLRGDAAALAPARGAGDVLADVALVSQLMRASRMRVLPP